MSNEKSRTGRRVVTAGLAAALALAGLAYAAPAGATEDVEPDRIARTTRFGTAAAVCEELAAAGQDVDTVVVATGRNFPDALAAAPLAAAEEGCVLLTEQAVLPAETLAALRALSPSTALVVGGTAAVSTAVADAIAAEGITVRRLAGDDRYCTAAAIAETIGATAGATAVLATGTLAPDALAAGAVASAGDGGGVMPILLANGNVLPACSRDALSDFDEVIVVGGTAAVGASAAAAAGQAAGDSSVTRLAGTDREGTAAAVAGYAVEELGWGPDEVLLAAGRPPAQVGPFSPDALVAGPLAALREAPILLAASDSSLGTAATSFIRGHRDTIAKVTAIGGTAVIGAGVLNQAVQAATPPDDGEEPGPGPGPVTGVPELVGVEHTRTTAAGHVDVRYIFDETLDEDVAVVQSAFHLASYDGENRTADIAEIDPGQPKSVVARFENASGFFFGVTTAAVDAGAVETATTLNDGPANPEGEAALQPVSFFAGATAAVSLVDITPPVVFQDITNGIHVRAGFVFNQPAYDNGACDNPGGAYLITTDVSDGDDRLRSVGCATGAAGVAGKTSWTFIFAPSQPTTAAAQAIVAKIRAGQIEAGTVEDQQGNPGVPVVRAVAGTASFTTGSPDLSSAVLRPATAVADPDTVDFTFDENIDIVDGTAFGIVYRDGSVVWSGSAAHPAADEKVVRAVYGATALNTSEYVAAVIVKPNAVTSDATGFENYPSQFSFAARTYAGGTSMAPNLLSVSRLLLAANATTNPFKALNQRTWQVTYTFDKDIAPGSFTYTDYSGTDVIDQSGSFAVYSTAGVRAAFGPVAGERYCLHHDEHTKGAKLIICYLAEGGAVLPSASFSAIERGAVAGVASDTVTSVLPPADPWNHASIVRL